MTDRPSEDALSKLVRLAVREPLLETALFLAKSYERQIREELTAARAGQREAFLNGWHAGVDDDDIGYEEAWRTYEQRTKGTHG